MFDCACYLPVDSATLRTSQDLNSPHGSGGKTALERRIGVPDEAQEMRSKPGARRRRVGCAVGRSAKGVEARSCWIGIAVGFTWRLHPKVRIDARCRLSARSLTEPGLL